MRVDHLTGDREPLFPVPGWSSGPVPRAGEPSHPVDRVDSGQPAGGRGPGIDKRIVIAAVAVLAAVLMGIVVAQFSGSGDEGSTAGPTSGGIASEADVSGGDTAEGAASPPIVDPPRPPQPVASSAAIVGTCDEGGSCGVKQRTAPYTDAPRMYPDDLRDGMTVTAVCQTTGDVRSSQGYGSSSAWYRLDNGAYVNSVYMNLATPGLPSC